MLIPAEMPISCVQHIFSFHLLPCTYPYRLNSVWSIAVSLVLTLEQHSSYLLVRGMAGILTWSDFFCGLEVLVLPYQGGLLAVVLPPVGFDLCTFAFISVTVPCDCDYRMNTSDYMVSCYVFQQCTVKLGQLSWFFDSTLSSRKLALELKSRFYCIFSCYYGCLNATLGFMEKQQKCLICNTYLNLGLNYFLFLVLVFTLAPFW